jgi:hypothetical protein
MWFVVGNLVQDDSAAGELPCDCHSKLTRETVKEAWLRPGRSYVAGRGSTHVAVDYVWNGGAGTSRKVLEWNLSAVTPDDASIQTLPSDLL